MDHDANNSASRLCVFSDIEMVKSNVEAMMKETWLPFNRKREERISMSSMNIIKSLKIIMHLAYDINYTRFESKQSIASRRH
jgi:hypothetical protein